MPQQDIVKAINRSQPEVSRLLHFHGTTPLAMKLRRARKDVIRTVKDVGGSNVRVFGSVSTGEETDNSDIDLLFHMDQPMTLMDAGRLEQRIEQIVGCPVDLVADHSIRPTFRERILAEAVPL